MLKHLFKGLLVGVAMTRLDRCRRLSTQLIKLEAAKCYLQGVRVARMSVIGALCLGLLVGLIGFGVLLVHAGLFCLLAWTLKEKALLGIALGIVYIAAGAYALRVAMAEQTWVEKSGTADILNDARNSAHED